MRSILLGLVSLPLLGGCAGYAADYAVPRASLITPQLTRYGLDATQSECVSARLAAGLSVWQLRQLSDVAGAATPAGTGALAPRHFVAVASNVTDPRVPQAVAEAAGQCGLTRVETVAAAPVEEPAAPSPAPTATPAASPTWVNMGAAATGQAIAVEAASIQQEASTRRAWFRLTNPGQASTSAVSYLLRIDCPARTINPLAFRQYGPAGTVAVESDYGPNGEGALPVETGTVMEIAYLALCT